MCQCLVPFSSRFSRHSAIATKMRTLAERGAAGIVLVNPPGAADGKTGFETLAESGRFGQRLEIPVFQVSPEVADRMLTKGDKQKRDLVALRELADNDEIDTLELNQSVEVSLVADLEVDDRLETQNVAAVLRGKGDLADKWIVIGAHYDHVGYGYTGTSSSNIGKLHPGADDNASGTAGLLIAAKRLAEEYVNAGDAANLRSIMFIAFSAEESGLIGSKHFVEHSPIDAKATTLMVNMDMIGRLRSDSVQVQGISTADGFDKLLQSHFEESGLRIEAVPGGRGPSDHSSFFNAGVPVLFMFTGTHPDYHKPTDLAHTVNPAGAVKVIDLICSIVMDVTDEPMQLKFVMASGGAGGGRGPASRVRLGIQPAYAAELETGVLVESVSDGTTAADAGIKPGDILLAWNNEELSGAQRLFELLGKHEPGDLVRLTVKRGEEELTLEATLKSREGQ